MSSPYQSRLLTFVSERSLKLRDQAQRRLRQAQLAALWGTQIVLYPFYAAFQSTRVISRQVGQTARRAFPRLRAAATGVRQSGTLDSVPAFQTPASDSPIRRTLRSLDLFALPLPITSDEAASASNRLSNGLFATADGPPQNPEPQGPVAQPPQICGIACLVTSQRLVLVDQYSAVHDVLTSAQEQYLRRRLILELAKFWYAHKQFQLAHQSPTPLPLPSDRNTMMPPVRAWRRLMAWMQTSPVAVSANLFQEARLPDSLLHSRLAVDHSSTVPTYPFPLIDGALSNIAPAAPALPKPPTWWSRLLPSWLQSSAQELGRRGYAAAENNSDPSAIPNQWFDPDHQGDEKGWENANQIVQRRQTNRPAIRPSLPMPPQDQWAALYQADPALLDEIEDYLLGPYGANGLPALMPSPDQTQAGDMAREHSLNAGDRQPGVLQVNRSDAGLSPTQGSDDLPVAPTLAQTTPAAAGLETTWLEVQATSAGYDRHPLERVLAWVDQSLLWAETWLIKLLQLLSPPR